MTKAFVEKLSYVAVLNYLKTMRRRRGKKRMTPRKAWNRLEGLLDELEVTPKEKKAIALWIWENMTFHHPETVKPRELHDLEAVALSPKAHCELLDAIFEGMITAPQGERLIDEMVELEPPDLEVDLEQVEAAIASAWKRNILHYSEIKVN